MRAKNILALGMAAGLAALVGGCVKDSNNDIVRYESVNGYELFERHHLRRFVHTILPSRDSLLSYVHDGHVDVLVDENCDGKVDYYGVTDDVWSVNITPKDMRMAENEQAFQEFDKAFAKAKQELGTQ